MLFTTLLLNGRIKKNEHTERKTQEQPPHITLFTLFIRKYDSFKSVLAPTSPIADTNMRVTRAISLTNFMVATSALGFQVFVLYPWHKELDNGFEDLKKEHMKVLEAVGKSVSEQQRMAFSNRLNELKTESSRRWWWM